MDLKLVADKLKSRVKIDIDLEGFIMEDVVAGIVEPEIRELAEKLKKAIPGQWDDAIIDAAMAQHFDALKEKLRKEMARVEARIEKAI